MRIYYSSQHLLHNPKQELHRGQMVKPHEGPHRMDMLKDGLERHGFTHFSPPGEFGLDPIRAVHRVDYVHFLQTAYERWTAAGYSGDVLPMSYPVHPRRETPPQDIDGAAGYYCSSSDTVVTATTWQALREISNVAISAADHVAKGGQSAFALIRPPGHHAGAFYMSGYCHLNFSAMAAQHLRDRGARKVAILDVDFHHGNGTQDIFYDRDDVYFTSLHGHPDYHFPYFWGHKDEKGAGTGEGATVNIPLQPGTDWDVWSDALMTLISKIHAFGVDSLVVSLGVDTFENDPISAFKLTVEDYPKMGAAIAGLGLPTVFIMEGGYGVPEIGDNVAGVLAGFSNV